MIFVYFDWAKSSGEGYMLCSHCLCITVCHISEAVVFIRMFRHISLSSRLSNKASITYNMRALSY